MAKYTENALALACLLQAVLQCDKPNDNLRRLIGEELSRAVNQYWWFVLSMN